MIRIMLGNVGCLSGDSIININRCKKGFKNSIYYIYNQWNQIPMKSKQQWDLSKPTFVRSFDGNNIHLHEIENVVYSGKKQLFLLELENGRSIKATSNHKIQTNKGMIPLEKLKIGEEIMCDTLKSKSITNKFSKPYYKLKTKLQFHKNKKGVRQQVLLSRLIIEAQMNNLLLEKFIYCLRNNKKESQRFKFLDLNYIVHHKDENTKNNNINNLQIMTLKEHKLHHANYGNFNQGVPKFSKIKSINKIGIEDTYDIVCKSPHHNFVANGIIVHNSGKTASMVREIVLNEDTKTTFSNIILKGKGIKNKTKVINRGMIFQEKVIKVKANGDNVTKLVFNADYWKNIRKTYPNGINVVIDEAHTLIDSRRSMSTENVIMNDFMSLLRRILGDSGDGYGELVLITQLGRRLDVNARELATSIHYHVCHYKRTCAKCNYNFWETNEVYQKPKLCPKCGNRKMIKSNFIIEKWEFDSMENLTYWIDFKKKSYQKHYYITDIENYFKNYDTFQWENMISEY